jgi:hypothetical protein
MSEATTFQTVAPETKLSAVISMAISQRVKTGKKDSDGEDIMENKEIGKIKLPIPTLADFGINAAIGQKQDDGTTAESDEDGIPLYSVPAYDWLMYAVVNQVKAQSRNKFNKAELREGQSLATTFAELVAVGERTGEAMKARYDAKKSFAAYLESDNKSAVIVKVLSDLFHNESAIVTAQDKFVNALEGHLQKWIPTLTAVDAGRYERKINSIAEQLSARNKSLEELSADMAPAPAATPVPAAVAA